MQRTFRKIKEALPEANLLVATGNSQVYSIESQIEGDYDLVVEPERRDTAPAIMLSCAKLAFDLGADPNDSVIVLPIDTYADDGYYKSLARLAEAVDERPDGLVLLGIEPTYPSEKYVYIVPVNTVGDLYEVSCFAEKPSEAKAQSLIEKGALWNGGIFGFKLGYGLDILRRYTSSKDLEEIIENYSEFPKVSFDYEVVEKADSIAVVPCQGEWKDLGTWNTLSEEMAEAYSGRIVFDGDVLFDSGEQYDEEGKIIVDANGKPVKNKSIDVDMLPYRKKMQMVFQDPYSSLNPRMTVEDIIGEPLDVHKLYSSRAERRDRILELMGYVGLNAEHATRYAHEFSGGQRQRIGIARALAVRPKFIVCDEPVSALDVSIQAQVVNLMKDIQQETGTAYLFIAHDLSMVKYISDRIGVLHLGHLLETGTTDEIFENPIHPYTKSLLSAIPTPNPIVEKTRSAESYDYATSGIDYTLGTEHHVGGTHYVKCTDEELAKWNV